MFLLPCHLQHIVVDVWHFMLMRIPWLCRLPQRDCRSWLVTSAMITTAVPSEPSALCTLSWFCASFLPLNYCHFSHTCDYQASFLNSNYWHWHLLVRSPKRKVDYFSVNWRAWANCPITGCTSSSTTEPSSGQNPETLTPSNREESAAGRPGLLPGSDASSPVRLFYRPFPLPLETHQAEKWGPSPTQAQLAESQRPQGGPVGLHLSLALRKHIIKGSVLDRSRTPS